MTEFTTIEKLAMNISPSYDAIVRYKDFVCLATMNYKGEYEAEIYEYVDEADEYAEIECRLSLNEKADVAFENSGEAIKWCFEYIDSLVKVKKVPENPCLKCRMNYDGSCCGCPKGRKYRKQMAKR